MPVPFITVWCHQRENAPHLRHQIRFAAVARRGRGPASERTIYQAFLPTFPGFVVYENTQTGRRMQLLTLEDNASLLMRVNGVDCLTLPLVDGQPPAALPLPDAFLRQILLLS
jgi:hypothetical protein